MQTLPTSFTAQGVQFTQLARHRDVALLKRSQHGIDFHEVVIVQHRPAQTKFGKTYPAREVMPPTSDFGKYGWSFKLLVNAQHEFDAQVKKRYPGERAANSPAKA